MNIRQTLQSLLGTFMGAALLFSCASEDVSEEESSASLELLTDFLKSSNEQSVEFDIEYDVVDDYRVVFDVYAENPFEVTSEGFSKKNVQPIISAMTNGDGVYHVNRVISNGVKEIYVVSNSVGVPALLHGYIQNGMVKPQEVDMSSWVDEDNATASRAASSLTYLGTWNSWGRPNYIDASKSCDITKDDLRSITAALPEWQKVEEEYTKSDYIYVKQEAEVWISLLSAKSLFNNALGYYCYTEGMSKDDIKEVIALPRTNISWFSFNGLKYGEYVKLKYLNPTTGALEDKFPAGARIGWVLHRSGFYCAKNTVNEGTYQFYSNEDWNPESTRKHHTAIFTTNKGDVIVGFEDMYNDSFFGDNDCNDIVFHVDAYPENAVVTSAEIPDVPQDSVEEEVDVVQPLSLIVDVPEDDELANDLYVASKSVLNVVDGNVVGVNDVLYIASAATMNDVVTQTYSEDEQERKVVVRTTVKFLLPRSDSEGETEEKKGRTVVRTTVKNTTWAVETRLDSRSVWGDFASVDELILATIDEHRAKLANGEVIKLEIIMELEGVAYDNFVECIDVPPYSPFIENSAE